MNKKELINAIAEDTGFTKKDAAFALDSVINTIMTAISDGDEVNLVGFGKFSSVDKPAGTARNPRDGKPVKVPAKRVPKFKFSTAFKNSLIK